MSADHFSKDIRDFIKCLHNNSVRYLIVGGEAVIYYGNPRLTGDVDFFYDSSTDNTEKLYLTLTAKQGPDIKEGEMETINNLLYFLGLNTYYETMIKGDGEGNPLKFPFS